MSMATMSFLNEKKGNMIKYLTHLENKTNSKIITNMLIIKNK